MSPVGTSWLVQLRPGMPHKVGERYMDRVGMELGLWVWSR